MNVPGKGGGAVGLEGPREKYNVIVVGGGIYGATMAWEAASRGLSVALFEQADFGSGTSANSLKVIHSGIRYLQNLDLMRLRQSVCETRVLLKIAPHLVRPMQCVTPTYQDLARSKAALWIGTRLYESLAIDRNRGLDPARRLGESAVLSLEELKELAPGLSGGDVTGAASWWDAQVHNSERMVLAFVMSAREKGAHVRNYTRVREHIADRDRVQGVVVEDVFSGQQAEVFGDVTVDCRGPWAGRDESFQRALGARESGFATAMNLVVRRKFSTCAMGVKTTNRGGVDEGGRLLFFAPWRDGTIVGTWYYQAGCTPGALSVSRGVVEQAIREVNAALPCARVGLGEVTVVHVGQLPAKPVSMAGAEPEPASKYRVLDGADGAAGLIWVQGVKYTTARGVAAKALRTVARYLGKRPGPPVSHRLPLYGGDISDVNSFRQVRMDRYGSLLKAETISRLLDNYGSRMDAIVAYTNEQPDLAAPVPGTNSAIRAELAYVLENEMPATLSDLLLRRTDLGTFAMPSAETIDFSADLMAKKHGWDAATREQNIRALCAQYPEWVTGPPHPGVKCPNPTA